MRADPLPARRDVLPRRVVLSAGALLLLAGCASGPELAGIRPAAALVVTAPAWRVGSQWQYSDGYGLKVTRVDGPETLFQRTDDPRQWIARRGFLREDAQSDTTLRKLLFEDLPPGGGQVLSSTAPVSYRREYLADGVTHAHATSWSVEGRQTVRVPAGEFDCAVLVMRTRSLDDDWTGYERWWFSPRAQNYVRLEYRYGPEQAGSRVLMQYNLVGGGAPATLQPRPAAAPASSAPDTSQRLGPMNSFW